MDEIIHKGTAGKETCMCGANKKDVKYASFWKYITCPKCLEKMCYSSMKIVSYAKENKEVPVVTVDNVDMDKMRKFWKRKKDNAEVLYEFLVN